MEHQLDEIKYELQLISKLLQKIVDNQERSWQQNERERRDRELKEDLNNI